MQLGNDDYKNILDSINDAVYFTDRDRQITYWNKAAETLTGYAASEVIGTHCSDNVLIHVDEKGLNLCQSHCPLSKTIADGSVQKVEAYLHHKNGHRMPVFIRTAPVRDKTGKIIGAVEIFSDNSVNLILRQRADELQKLALLDPVTGVGNRRYAEINIQTKLDEMRRYGWRFGLLFVDIDLLKKINDTYGHQVGDNLLKIVATTLANNTRASDMVARWGGDEFLVILLNTAEAELYRIANKLRALVEKSTYYSGTEMVSVTVSIGATIAQPNDTMNILIQRVDNLGYRSKNSGRNRITVYQPGMEI